MASASAPGLVRSRSAPDADDGAILTAVIHDPLELPARERIRASRNPTPFREPRGNVAFLEGDQLPLLAQADRDLLSSY